MILEEFMIIYGIGVATGGLLVAVVWWASRD